MFCVSFVRQEKDDCERRNGKEKPWQATLIQACAQTDRSDQETIQRAITHPACNSTLQKRLPIKWGSAGLFHLTERAGTHLVPKACLVILPTPGKWKDPLFKTHPKMNAHQSYFQGQHNPGIYKHCQEIGCVFPPHVLPKSFLL